MVSSLRRSSLFPYLIVVLGIFSLGFSAILVRVAGAPGAVTGFYRMAIAASVLTVPFLKRNGRTSMLNKRDVMIASFGGLFFAADLLFWNTGVLMSGAVNPTLMGNTAPVWVGLGALVLFREKLSIPFWLGLAIALCGAALILGQDALKELSVGMGTLFGLMAGVFYGGYFLITQKGRQTLDSISYFWIAAVSSSIVLLVAAFLLGQEMVGYSTRTYLSLLGLGIVVQVFGQFSFSYALGYLPASFVSPAGLGQPVVTAILAGPLLGESLSGLQITGGLAVILGVFLVHRSRLIQARLAVDQV